MDSPALSRREALRRLGFGVLAAYAVPEILAVSSAAASTDSSDSSDSSEPSLSAPSGPLASRPSAPEASLPSGPSQDDNWRQDDTCSVRSTGSRDATISNSDFRRAQRAVRKGKALPLSEVFETVQGEISGQLIEVRFSNSSAPPIYQFRIVSERGKLITVFSDASNAEILRIVNC